MVLGVTILAGRFERLRGRSILWILTFLGKSETTTTKLQRSMNQFEKMRDDSTSNKIDWQNQVQQLDISFWLIANFLSGN